MIFSKKEPSDFPHGNTDGSFILGFSKGPVAPNWEHGRDFCCQKAIRICYKATKTQFFVTVLFQVKEYKEALRLITKNEEKLQATMTNEQKKLFSRYTDAVREHQMTADCLIFQIGFKLGARIMLEVMEE